MGCSSSKPFVINEEIFGYDSGCASIYKSIGIPERELSLLHTAFYDMDADDQGVIRLDEFLTYFNLEYCRIFKKIFSAFNEDDSGCMSFASFVLNVWNFLSMNYKKVCLFLFRIYDESKRGTLNTAELKELVEDLHTTGGLLDSYKLSKLFERIPSSSLAELPYLIWIDENKDFLDTVLSRQSQLRSRLIGERFWKQAEILRLSDLKQSSPEFDTVLMSRLSEERIQHTKYLRSKGAAKATANAAFTTTRQRITFIMMEKLNQKQKNSDKASSKKGGSSSKSKGDKDSTKEKNATSSSSSSNKATGRMVDDELGELQNNPKRELPKEARRRRSIIKPSLADKVSSKKISPESAVALLNTKPKNNRLDS
jgi:Ca2+-binding EF-hand superfamily protein